MRDEHSILTVSSILQGQYGLSDSSQCTYDSDRNGVNSVLEVPLTEEEQRLLEYSAKSLKEIVKGLIYNRLVSYMPARHL